MNKEIQRINTRELELGATASWHDQYKDSAYVYVGNLPRDLTEGDVITVMSQYGEVMDINLPRDKATGKSRGFAFLMYEDQRSTVLAVDNLNGAKVLDRTIRVDHVVDYKQPKEKGEDGEWIEQTEQSLNAKPELKYDNVASESSAESVPDIDPEDPMRDYLLAKHKEAKSKKKAHQPKSKHADETPEERRARKRRRKEQKARKTEDSARVSTRRDDREDQPQRLRVRDGRDRLSDRRHESRSRSRSPAPRSSGRYYSRSRSSERNHDVDRDRRNRSHRS